MHFNFESTFKTMYLKTLRTFLNRYLFIYLSKLTLYSSVR